MIEQYKLYVSNETESAATIRIRYHYIDRLSADLDVTTATETQLETWLRSHGWAPTSVNSALASIRHFYGTELVRAGVHMRVVQTLMRHESPATTAIYTEVDFSQLRDGIEHLRFAA